MPKRHDMLDSLDSLKMLASDGVFANKEFFGGSKKIAPEPHTHAAQTQALKTQEEKLQALRAELVVFRAELQAQDKRQTKRDQDLFLKEQLLEKRQKDIDFEFKQREQRLETRKHLLESNLKIEREKNNNEWIRLKTQENSQHAEASRLKREERKLTALVKENKTLLDRRLLKEQELDARKDKYKQLKDDVDTLKQQLEREQNSLETEKDHAKQEQKKREDLTNTVKRLSESAKNDTLANLKLFVCMWKDEILTMIRQDKLRCIIPSDTTNWFKYNYYNLDSARQTDLMYWLSETLDHKPRDLRIDINTETQRFVIFYLQSKLDKYAAEYWESNQQNALNNMHCTQDDDKDKVDQKLLVHERGF